MTTQRPTAPRAPRQLTRKEIRARFPLAYDFDPKTLNVSVPGDWRRQHLVAVELVPGLPKAWLHRAAAPVFEAWLERLRARQLHTRIISVDGGFVPRIMRGAKLPLQLDRVTAEQFLSRHSNGIALDINADQNKRGAHPAPLGAHGCVLELVDAAYEVGLVWGGAWRGGMIDAMHFEIGVPLGSS